MFSRVVCAVLCVSTSFCCRIMFSCVDTPQLFVHLSCNGHLGDPHPGPVLRLVKLALVRCSKAAQMASSGSTAGHWRDWKRVLEGPVRAARGGRAECRHRAAGHGLGQGLWVSALGSWVRAGQKSGALGSPRGSIEDIRTSGEGAGRWGGAGSQGCGRSPAGNGICL